MINRGNYRSDVFKSSGAADSFLKTLEEAVEKYGWILFGYVLMRNHYHLAIATPRGNLSAGMHWLQSTFSTRFNRFRGERGICFKVDSFLRCSRMITPFVGWWITFI